MTTDYKRLYRSHSNRMFSGLCAGLGEYIGMDPTVVRIGVALGSIFLFPTPIIIYLVMMFIVPEEPVSAPTAEVIES